MKSKLHDRFVFSLLLLASTQLCGCADRREEGRYVLNGNVTYDGEPVADGTIELFPTGGPNGKPSGAKIVDGRYEMERLLGPGLGTYRVVILAQRPSGRKVPVDEGSSEMIDVPAQFIPPMYNERSTLTVEVTGDAEGVDFDLEKPKRGRRRR